MTGFTIYYSENVKTTNSIKSSVDMLIIIAKTEVDALMSVSSNYPDIILKELKFKTYPVKGDGVAIRISR